MHVSLGWIKRRTRVASNLRRHYRELEEGYTKSVESLARIKRAGVLILQYSCISGSGREEIRSKGEQKAKKKIDRIRRTRTEDVLVEGLRVGNGE
jgi:hypothetical protein